MSITVFQNMKKYEDSNLMERHVSVLVIMGGG